MANMERLNLLRALLLALTLLLAGCLLRPSPSSVNPDLAPFGGTVQHYAARLGLRPLRNAMPPGEIEVRLWEGFGTSGVQLLRVVYADSTWSATSYAPVDRPQIALTIFRPDSLEWTYRWQSLQATQYFALPPSPRRRPTNLIVTDGWSVVLEVATDRGYWIVGASNPADPDTGCSADDQALLESVMAFAQHPNWDPLAPCRPLSISDDS